MRLFYVIFYALMIFEFIWSFFAAADGLDRHT